MARLVVMALGHSLPRRQGVKLLRHVREFRADWALGGRSASTADTYIATLRNLLVEEDEPDLATVKAFIADHPGAQTRRLRARAARAWFRWADEEGIMECGWWRRIPLPNVEETPQRTADEHDYAAVLARARTPRDRALVATLWATGMRRSEIARMEVEHVDLDAGHVLVPITKSKRHRVAPLSPQATKLLRVYLRRHPGQGPLWLGERGPLTSQGIRGLLERLGAPSAHSWRRGWATAALMSGVSQTSLETAGGWRSGSPMVGRYVRACASDLAMSEFQQKRWSA